MSDQSVAYKLMRDAIHASRTTSWLNINSERRKMLEWMIWAKVRFEPDDFIIIGRAFGGAHWFPPHDEALTAACCAKNKTAIVAALTKEGLPAWKWEPNDWEKVPSGVLHIGAVIYLDNERHTITSFGVDGRTLIACTYHPWEVDKPRRIKTRRTITFEEAAEITRVRRVEIRAARKGPARTYEVMLSRCEQAVAAQMRDPRNNARPVLAGVVAEIRAMKSPEQQMLDLAASIEADLQGVSP